MTATPTLLTPEEAAAIARCSVKTVRRAYATGDLTAYRRRGSRAILLDKRDVLAWVQGEMLQPVGSNGPQGEPSRSVMEARQPARGKERSLRALRTEGHARVDLSVSALHKRRATRTERLP